MRKTLTLLLLTLSMSVVAQNKQGKVDPPLFQKLGHTEKSIIDYANTRFYYAFNATDIKDIDSYLDLGMLQIGDKYTKYSSSFVAHSDSLVIEWQKENPKAKVYKFWIELRGRMDGYWSEYQYSDIITTGNELTEWAVMPLHYERDCARYSEPYPLMKWTLCKETMEICGHKCQKAICHYRGRDFIAWFAPDILIRKGPWKFGGLPGLIMKVYDKDNLYTFECVKIEKGKFPIVKFPDKYFPEQTRAKVYKLQIKMNNDFDDSVGLMRLYTKKQYEYHPLELE